MSVTTEKFDGGIDTTQDPALLEPGVHQAIKNLIYTQDSDTLMSMPGRASWYAMSTATAQASIKGLFSATFDNGSQFIVTNDGTTRHVINAANHTLVATGSCASATTQGGVQYDNRYFTYDGKAVPQMLLQDGTMRRVGLAPVTAQIGGLATAVGSWLGLATGYFDYWVTEVAKLTATAETPDPDSPYELESAYTADPQTIKVANMTTRVIVRLPTELMNPGVSTHFRVYRAGPKATIDAKEFPIGEQVMADIPVSEVGEPVYDGSAISELFSPNATGAYSPPSGTWASWVDPEKIYGAGYAVQATAASGGNRALANCVNLYTFPSPTFSTAVKDPVVGLKFDVTWQLQQNVAVATGTYVKQAGAIRVLVTFDSGTTWHSVGAQAPTKQTAVNATGVFTYGGEDSLWSMADLEVADFANFKVRLEVDGVTGSSTTSWAGKMAVDTVTATVYYNGSGLEAYRQYNAVIIEALGVQSAISAAGSPPPCSTATVFEGAIVSNDMEHPAWIKYSQAGAVEYWPELYFLNFETDDRDEVTYLGTVNNKLICGLKGAIYRINYLPTEEDADGRRGLAYERLSRTHGIANAKSACTFQGPDGRELLAFVSHNGVFATDGYTITKLNSRINWRRLMGLNSVFTGSLALVNDPDLGLLWFHTSVGGTYALHYQGKLRWTGPHNFGNTNQPLTCAITARQSDGSFISYLGYTLGAIWKTDQIIYLSSEWSGTWIRAHDYPLEPASVITRRIAPAGLSGEATLNYCLIYGGFVPSYFGFWTFHSHWQGIGVPYIIEPYSANSNWTYESPVRVECAAVSGQAVELHFENEDGSLLPLQELYLSWQEGQQEGNLA